MVGHKRLTLALHTGCRYTHTRRLSIERREIVKEMLLTRANTIIASSGNILRLEIAAAQKRIDMITTHTTVNTHSHIKRSMPLLPADIFAAGFAWRCGCDEADLLVGFEGSKKRWPGSFLVAQHQHHRIYVVS